MNAKAEASILPHFVTLTDPRQKGKIEHMLQDIIILSVCAVISDADTWPDIYEYAPAELPPKKTMPTANKHITILLRMFFILLFLC